MQYPRIAATTGLGDPAIACITLWPYRANSNASDGVSSASSVISAPVENARSVPVITAPASSRFSATFVIRVLISDKILRSSRGNPSSLSSVKSRMFLLYDAQTSVHRTLRAVRSSRDSLADKIDDRLRGRSGKENFCNASFFERGNIGFRNNSAD
jgi:hypothetical protein